MIEQHFRGVIVFITIQNLYQVKMLLLVIFVLPFASSSISSASSLSHSGDGMDADTLPLYPLYHRYVENYTAEILAKLTESHRKILLAQIYLDARNDVYAPAEDDFDGPPQEYTPWGTIVLGNVIHKGGQSAVFEIRDHPDLLIKYQANCEDLDPAKHLIHPLIRDYWYMLESFALRLSPEPLFLSPPSLFSRLFGVQPDRKYLFELSVSTVRSCIRQGGVIRYMIMRKSQGKSLHHFRHYYQNSTIPLNVAAAITTAVIAGLEKLHEEAHIVHGDIHAGNIMVEWVGELRRYRISFIDFGRAFRDNRNFTNDRVNPIGYWNHYLCSPWQIDGREWARRDDVYKAILTFAIITNPIEYIRREEIEMRLRGTGGAIAMKRNRFMFQMAPPARTHRSAYISTFDPLEIESTFLTRTRDRLMNHLHMIQQMATVFLDDINDDIPYNQLFLSFNWITRYIG